MRKRKKRSLFGRLERLWLILRRAWVSMIYFFLFIHLQIAASRPERPVNRKDDITLPIATKINYAQTLSCWFLSPLIVFFDQFIHKAVHPSPYVCFIFLFIWGGGLEFRGKPDWNFNLQSCPLFWTSGQCLGCLRLTVKFDEFFDKMPGPIQNYQISFDIVDVD